MIFSSRSDADSAVFPRVFVTISRHFSVYDRAPRTEIIKEVVEEARHESGAWSWENKETEWGVLSQPFLSFIDASRSRS